MYFVYVIKSKVDGRLYKGMTEDLQKRLALHNAGKVRSTKGYRTWELVYVEKYSKKEDARARELFLTSMQHISMLPIIPTGLLVNSGITCKAMYNIRIKQQSSLQQTMDGVWIRKTGSITALRFRKLTRSGWLLSGRIPGP